MENTPNAAAAPATEANPNTNSNPAPATAPAASQTPEVPQITIEQVAEFIGMKPELLKERMDFEEANGGPEKAYANFKKYVSDPSTRPSNQPQQTAEPTTPVQSQSEPQQPVAPEPYKPEKGYITSQEYFAKKYNADLASEYPEIADYINKGEYLKEATDMGMKLVDVAGNMNDVLIHKFLDMKKAAIAPPASTNTPITNTPTVDYLHVEGDIISQDVADDIIKQGTSHPRYAEALQYTRERLFSQKSNQKQK